MTRSCVGTMMTAALAAAVGCGDGTVRLPSNPPVSVAVAASVADPSARAAALEAAAPVPGEETLRFRMLARALEAAEGSPSRWRRLLEAGPPEEVRRRARLGLADALEREGRRDDAVAVLREGMAREDPAAAIRLLELGAGRERAAVARWLAVRYPVRLRAADPSLDREVLGTLPPAERLERVRALLGAGRPGQAARELRRFPVPRGLRRAAALLGARAALARGRPREALRRLPRNGGPEASLLAARAWRARAWALFPRRSSDGAFARALASARRALTGPGEREAALELVLECATQLGRLSEAWAAWRELGALGWRGNRREWLGRRLGVALAEAGARGPVRALQAELPAHRRCLAYWLARRVGDREALAELAAGPVEDLYARWAARRLGTTPPRYRPRPPLGSGSPPPVVARWLAAGRREEALEVWWTLAGTRGLTPKEALALARFEAAARPHRAIRAIRAGFPAVREGRPDLVPRDALELYLPLPWPRLLEGAARTAGLPVWLLAGQVRQESLWVPTARSHRGARGLLQLLPITARERARALGLPPQDLDDPAANLRLGALELARLREELGSLDLALAAYNGGLARVRRLRGRWSDPERLVEWMPVPEMYGYVRRVVYLAGGYRALHGGGSAPAATVERRNGSR